MEYEQKDKLHCKIANYLLQPFQLMDGKRKLMMMSWVVRSNGKFLILCIKTHLVFRVTKYNIAFNVKIGNLILKTRSANVKSICRYVHPPSSSLYISILNHCCVLFVSLIFLAFDSHWKALALGENTMCGCNSDYLSDICNVHFIHDVNVQQSAKKSYFYDNIGIAIT